MISKLEENFECTEPGNSENSKHKEITPRHIIIGSLLTTEKEKARGAARSKWYAPYRRHTREMADFLWKAVREGRHWQTPGRRESPRRGHQWTQDASPTHLLCEKWHPWPSKQKGIMPKGTTGLCKQGRRQVCVLLTPWMKRCNGARSARCDVATLRDADTDKIKRKQQNKKYRTES